MGALISKIIFKKGRDQLNLAKYESLNEIEVKTLNGEKTTMGELT
jgi:hypothetical protein